MQNGARLIKEGLHFVKGSPSHSCSGKYKNPFMQNGARLIKEWLHFVKREPFSFMFKEV